MFANVTTQHSQPTFINFTFIISLNNMLGLGIEHTGKKQTKQTKQTHLPVFARSVMISGIVGNTQWYACPLQLNR